MNARDFLYLGRGVNYPIALEGALKLKEISYIHAEGYAAGRDETRPHRADRRAMPVVVLAPQGSHYDKIVSNLQQVKARLGRVIALVTEGNALARRHRRRHHSSCRPCSRRCSPS
jgi:glucosamine--fructose-6-phosphate aminotransferase (isomerizing)